MAGEEISWHGHLDLILSHYSDKPDDYKVVVGCFEPGWAGLPEFKAFMQMTLGDLRNLASKE